jgi:hypothetical protein
MERKTSTPQQIRRAKKGRRYFFINSGVRFEN